MSRPHEYKEVADHWNNPSNLVEKKLWTCDRMYAVTVDGKLGIETNYNPNTSYHVKRYMKMLLPSLKQAQTRAEYIFKNYNVKCQVREIKFEGGTNEGDE